MAGAWLERSAVLSQGNCFTVLLMGSWRWARLYESLVFVLLYAPTDEEMLIPLCPEALLFLWSALRC